MRWVTATDLEQWADSHDAQESLPELVARLIDATVGPVAELRIPSGDSVRLTG
jgi:hypothetical protein